MSGQEGWRIEVVDSLQGLEHGRDEWNALFSQAKLAHPALHYDWFALWYALFESAQHVRIIVLRQQDGQLRAVFPGIVQERRFAGLAARCFSYAANGYSPCGSIIARTGDQEAVRAIIDASLRVIRPKPHLVLLPEVPDDSETAMVLEGGGPGGAGLRIEHAKEVSFTSLAAGWASYCAERSSRKLSDLHKMIRKLNKIGPLEFVDLSSPDRSGEAIDRLQRLDGLTWQGQQGTGLFSTPDNERFYRRLLSFADPGIGVRLFLATVNAQDIAYSLTLRTANVCYGLKMGYDPQYARYSPGSLTMCHFLEQAAAEGIQVVDMGPDSNREKRQWQTHCLRYRNWWLFNRRTLRGRLLESATWLHDVSRRKTGDVRRTED